MRTNDALRRGATRRGWCGGLASLGLVGLGACVPKLPGTGPGPRTFRLTPKTTFGQDLTDVAWSLAVSEPTSERTLDTNRIAVITHGTAIDYVADATWIDRAPSMVQTVLVQSFRASGAVAAVGADRDQRRPDFLLRSDLRAFQLNRTDGLGTVRVRLDATLLRLPQRDIVAQRSFAADIAPTAAGVDAAVAAFDEALGRVMKELVPWALTAGSQAYVASSET